MLRTPSPKQLITRLYTCMQTDAPLTRSRAREKWDRELTTTLTDEPWEFCCAQMTKLTPNYILRLIHFKFIHRSYRTPINLYKMGLRPDDKCWRCGAEGASFLHMAWECPVVWEYWQLIFHSINQILETAVTPSPVQGLLGYVKHTHVSKRKLHAILLLFAKRQLAQLWGSKRKPTQKEWIRSITYGQTQLAIFWDLMPLTSRPRDIWGPFLEWLRIHIDSKINTLGVTGPAESQ